MLIFSSALLILFLDSLFIALYMQILLYLPLYVYFCFSIFYFFSPYMLEVSVSTCRESCFFVIHIDCHLLKCVVFLILPSWSTDHSLDSDWKTEAYSFSPVKLIPCLSVFPLIKCYCHIICYHFLYHLPYLCRLMPF